MKTVGGRVSKRMGVEVVKLHTPVSFSMLVSTALFITLCLVTGTVQTSQKEYLIQVKEEQVDAIKSECEKYGLKYIEKIVSNIHLFETHEVHSLQDFVLSFPEEILYVEPRAYSKVEFYEDCQKDCKLERWRRMVTNGIGGHSVHKVNDKFRNSLSTENKKCWPYYGMDIQKVWKLGFTGKGVNVAVVDNGVEFNHADLKENIDKNMSRSFVKGDDADGKSRPLHSYSELDIYASHGTLAAGLVAAEFGNKPCSAGVAYNATLISLTVFQLNEKQAMTLDFTFPDDHVSQALEHARNEIDIYLCSFNIDNKFSTSTNHIRTVLEDGILKGRRDMGSIFVFPAGNSRNTVHDCNTTPFTSSIYTITIASVGKGGTKPKYAVPCSCILASTYGKFNTYDGDRKLESTMVKNGCANFNGTSASTALAAGIIALVLEANPNLTWRDVQYIIVLSSSLERITDYKTMTGTNGAGLKYNRYFGFGLMDATAAVLLALKWKTVPEQITYTLSEHLEALDKPNSLSTVMLFPSCKMDSSCLRYIEHVVVNISYESVSDVEEQIEIILCSPAKTCSTLLNPKQSASSGHKRPINRNWNFTSVQFWGENPHGHWFLIARSKRSMQLNSQFCIRSAVIAFLGIDSKHFPVEFKYTATTKDKSETAEADIEKVMSDLLHMLERNSNGKETQLFYCKADGSGLEYFPVSTFFLVLCQIVFVPTIYILFTFFYCLCAS